MNLESIYIKPEVQFSAYISEWADKMGITVNEFDPKIEDQEAEGLLLINANQDIEKEMYDLHNLFDMKHIPTQKIDINGTLQVAVSNFEMWLRNYKCKNILILGSDELIKNENLDRFFKKIVSKVNA